MFEKLKSLFAPSAPSTAFATITVNSSADQENIPFGFFNVACHSGRASLGYKFTDLSGINYHVGTTVVDGGKRVTLVSRDELPTVRLTYQKPQNGTTTIGGNTVIDTDSLDRDGTVTWDGPEPQSSVSWV
jgi:hypothetical protein